MRKFISIILFLISSQVLSSQEIPLIDAHSQIDCNMKSEYLVNRLKELNISKSLISTRWGKCKGNASSLEKELLQLSQENPDVIGALLSMKIDGMGLQILKPDVLAKLNSRSQQLGFTGLGELIVQHAAHDHKRLKRSATNINLNDERVLFAIDLAKKMRFPLVHHIELRDNLDARDKTLNDLNELLSENRDVNFILIHMGQADRETAATLIKNHSNIYFIPSHSDPITKKKIKKRIERGEKAQSGWVNLFKRKCFEGECTYWWRKGWKDLVINNPDRFILGFDNVFINHWGRQFEKKVNMWRELLEQIPNEVAHQIAHKNAERLWNLKPIIE